MPEDKLKELDDPLFWKSVRNRRIFKHFIEGKTIDEICDHLHLRRSSVMLSVQNPAMIARLEDHLNIKLFDLDLKRLEAKHWVFTKLKAEFETRLKEASADTIVTQFLKLLGSQEPERKLNPKMVNIFLNLVKKSKIEKSPDEIEKDLETRYGYKQLKDESRNKKTEDGDSDSSTVEPEPEPEGAADSELDREKQTEDK